MNNAAPATAGSAITRLACASLACASLAALASCDAAPPVRRVIPVFGTIVEVDVAEPDSAGVELALDRVEGYFRFLDRNWRSFGPGELGRVNEALGAGRPTPVSPALRRVIERGMELTERSGGLFDPRVGGLVRLWGLQDPAHEEPGPLPADAQVRAARDTAIGHATLHWSDGMLASDGAVTLDLGSIGKGAALAGAAALLRTAGVRNALVNAGGDLIALGDHGGRPWRAGVRDPRGSGILGVIGLEPGETISSSGDYERFRTAGGRRYAHIIDPRTGYPATGSAGTTVLGTDPELAHAASTALMIAGKDGFDALLKRLGVDCALLVTSDGELVMTPAMRQRLRPR